VPAQPPADDAPPSPRGSVGPDSPFAEVLSTDLPTSGRLLASHWTEVDGLLRQADLKAQVLLGVDAIVLTAIAKLGAAGGGGSPVDTPVEYAAMVCLLGSIAVALLTLAPRRGGPSGTDGDLLYFEAAATMTPQEFTTRYLGMTQHAHVEHVLRQIHVKSKIATVKLARVRLAVGLLAAGIFLVGASVTFG